MVTSLSQASRVYASPRRRIDGVAVATTGSPPPPGGVRRGGAPLRRPRAGAVRVGWGRGVRPYLRVAVSPGEVERFVDHAAEVDGHPAFLAVLEGSADVDRHGARVEAGRHADRDA